MRCTRRTLLAATASLPALSLTASSQAASLKPEDAAEFLRYTQRAEADLKRRAAGGKITGFPANPTPPDEVRVFSMAKENPLDIGSAYIHDWTGQAFLPNATAAALLRILKDYNRHKEYYAPEVVNSRLLSHTGEELRSFLRLRKKKVLTVILDSEYRNRFFEVQPGAGYSMSHTTSIREVENAGESDERILADGEGQGFLWKLHAYWAWQETAGGLWAECRAISLSRDVPSGLGWAVAPIIRSLPRESLEATLRNTYKAVQAAR
ncbi:MAG: hypothetical protein KIT83_22145 [Bryobacterales bacterium]|nr:hypothetical protein [Bryobacterales bacterium]